jgi:glycosyltransferase involved in cell wall biosynthesis
MRLLFLNYEFPPACGGAGYASFALARELVMLGHNVDFLTAAAPGAPAEEERQGVRVRRVRAMRRGVHDVGLFGVLSFLCAAAGRLPDIMRRESYDACHYYFSLPTGLLSRLPGRHRQMPYVVSLRGSDVPGYDPRLTLLHRLLLPITRSIWRDAYRVVANSQGLRKMALSSAPGQTIDVILNGAESMPLKQQDGAARTELRLLAVSRLIERKGLATLIEALADLPAPYISLDIAGEGPCHESLLRLARERGVAGRVRFHGFVEHDNLAQLYRAADLFVLPSRAESCSMALLEAMAAGLPIVATRVDGTPELIEHGYNGLLVAPSDARALAAAILQLADDPAQRERFAAANRRLVAERYTWRLAAKRYEAIFSQAIAS